MEESVDVVVDSFPSNNNVVETRNDNTGGLWLTTGRSCIRGLWTMSFVVVVKHVATEMNPAMMTNILLIMMTTAIEVFWYNSFDRVVVFDAPILCHTFCDSSWQSTNHGVDEGRHKRVMTIPITNLKTSEIRNHLVPVAEWTNSDQNVSLC